MYLFVALLREVLRTKDTLKRLDIFVDQQVVFQAAFPREFLSTVFVLAEENLSRASGSRVKHL